MCFLAQSAHSDQLMYSFQTHQESNQNLQHLCSTTTRTNHLEINNICMKSHPNPINFLKWLPEPSLSQAQPASKAVPSSLPSKRSQHQPPSTSSPSPATPPRHPLHASPLNQTSPSWKAPSRPQRLSSQPVNPSTASSASPTSARTRSRKRNH